MLTQIEVETLRATVASSHTRRTFNGRIARVRFIDGPLENIETVIEAAASRAYRIDWCVITKTGPVQVLYKPLIATGELSFAEFFAGSR